MYRTGIPKIQYVLNAGAREVLCFQHYNAEQVGVANLKEELCVSGVMEVSVVFLLHSETLPPLHTWMIPPEVFPAGFM